MKKILQTIFSIKNIKKHKVICILGLKLKLKNHKLEMLELEKKFNKFNEKFENYNLLNYKRIRKITPFTSIDTIEIHIVEHCNLQCKGCVHFSPLAKDEYLDINEFEQDLKRMFELTDGNVKIINILGGEPLLHPNCVNFLLVARDIFSKSDIKLITNGLLLLEQSDEFYKKCAEHNITIEPTKYMNIGVNWEAVEKKCNDFKVKLQYFQNSEIQTKTLYKDILDINGKNDPKEQFLNCRLDDLSWFHLDHGKMYKCARIAYSRHFENHFGIDLNCQQNDYIDIYKVKSLDEILMHMTKPSPFCSHCNKMATIYNLPWEKSKKEITEWVE